MPFYTYRCNTCGHFELDVLQTIDSLHERVDCEKCLQTSSHPHRLTRRVPGCDEKGFPNSEDTGETIELRLGDKRIKMERLISTPAVINRGNEGTARAGRGRGSK